MDETLTPTDFVICALDGSPIRSESAFKDAPSYGDRYFHDAQEAQDWDDEQVHITSNEIQELYDYDR